MTKSAEQEAALTTACRWQARIGGGDISPEDRADFEQWLKASEHNRQAFERAELLWFKLEGLRSSAWATNRKTPPDLAEAVEPSTIWMLGWRLGHRATISIAAAIMLAVAIILISPSQKPTLYRTQVAQTEDVTLADGTQVSLGAETRLTASLSSSERLVVLQHGEAFFDVARDPTTPFLVTVGQVTIEVVGTAFAVRRSNRSVRVGIAEGEVAVSADGQTDKIMHLSAGEQVETNLKSGHSEVSALDARQIAAWRWGELVYRNAPLAEIIADVNRYFDGQLTISDPAAADLTLNAVFNTDDITGVLHTLEEALPIRVRQLRANRIDIRMR